MTVEYRRNRRTKGLFRVQRTNKISKERLEIMLEQNKVRDTIVVPDPRQKKLRLENFRVQGGFGGNIGVLKGHIACEATFSKKQQ